MSLSMLIRRLVPPSLKRRVRNWMPIGRVSHILSPYLPTTICVDVGASYYPHVKWSVFLSSPNTHWLAVEPNEANLAYVSTWAWQSKIATCKTGLSRDGGEKTLYITNVDTGSSLLPPHISESMKCRILNLDYFFPVTERKIDTLTLIQAISDMPPTAPICVKLDTQGTELFILQGAQGLFDAHRIVGIEMEATMLAQPFMRGAGKFWEACQYLEAQGMELLHVKPIPAVDRNGRIPRKYNTYLNECDAIFALRPDVAAGLPVEYRISLLAFYITNLFFEEALSLLEHDQAISEALLERGCNLKRLRSNLTAAI